ncbi:MAG: hypothetical protein Q7R81_04025 [Candidatus Peregrinibacteria bacterium]|nr:hypothetical protein [Candidatus Peregrinibacteria bacterium]
MNGSAVQYRKWPSPFDCRDAESVCTEGADHRAHALETLSAAEAAQPYFGEFAWLDPLAQLLLQMLIFR